ncbi:MAG TPA: hypothetical protein VMZ26_13955 [Pyrinomonadaceae bacterium]|nr:hypothetical protein [Pyrinomonadaceae bacterium]
MDDKANGAVPAADDEDLTTTAPNPQPNVWKMPDPVFRKTSGRLPKAFEREYFTEAPTQENPKPAAASDVNPPNHTEPAPQSPTLKIVLVGLGVLAMIVFIAVFLTVVYFFFWRS